MTRSSAAPGISCSEPKFELVVTVTRLAVPVTRRFPSARGVPAVGRTRTLVQVNRSHAFTLVLVTV